MSQFHPSISQDSLQGKVIVLTGGANGIGASFVNFCCQHGAYVCFGDLNTAKGEEVAQACCAPKTSSNQTSPPQALFHQTDVTDYQSILDLFDTTLRTYGRIDHAVAAAGIVEIGNWFDPELTLETVRKIPTRKVLDVNLLGCLYLARISSVYLRQNRQNNSDRSILLISSLAGFKESPGLFVYQASKHGVLGLMRSLRGYISSPSTHNIRVNAICPWTTETAMVKGVRDAWHKAQLPINAPLDVGKVMAGVVCDPTLNGKAMYVEGGRAWEIEGNIDRLEPQWLGEEPSRSLGLGQKVLGSGMDWAQ